MKKLAVALFVALLGFAFAAPAFALDNQFGGYWRVRMYNNTDFDGNGDSRNAVGDPEEIQLTDTRTRLYYTAVLNDNLKFVNKFEMDATWGVGGTSYGDIGADGVAVEVKNSYVDFNLGMANVKIGTQGATIHRGFIFDDDMSGIVASANGFTGLYAKVEENGDGAGDDVQMYHGSYAVGLNDLTVTPTFTYVDGDSDNELWYLGLDLDGTAGGFSYWATFIYNGGEIADADVDAWLVGAGASVALSDMASVHGEFFHATGQDDGDDITEFNVLKTGQSYYWAEIMGYGTFDYQVSNNSCADKISNITAINLGLTYTASDKLTLGADLWYAQLAEDDANGEDKLGTEVDLSAKYTIVEGLTMDVVAAYLFAGDATTEKVSNDENPFEIGTQFSISF
jgi:hypothetical protein